MIWGNWKRPASGEIEERLKAALFTRHRAYLIFLLGGGLFFIALIALLAGVAIHHGQADARKSANIAVTNLSSTFALEINNSVHQIDLGILAILDEVSRQQESNQWDDRKVIAAIAREDSRHADSVGFRIFGADGRLRYGVSNIVNRDVDFSQREEFRHLRENADGALLITPPFVGPVAQEWLVALARGITNPDGSFGGAVYTAMPARHLMQVFAAIDLGPGGSVALYHTSFQLAARFPEIKVGTSTISDQLRTIIASGVQTAGFENLSPVDGVRRIGHARKIDGMPYYLSVALADDDYLAEWRHDRNHLILFSALVTGIVLLGMVVIYRTRSNWRNAVRDLTISEEKLRGLFELSPVGIVRNSLDGRFVEFNESFRAITGYDSDELKRLDYWALTPEKYKEQEITQIKALQSTGFYGPYIKEYIRKDGASVPLHLRGMLMTGHDGKKYVWSLVEDITDINNLRQAEMQAEVANRTKSRFLANMSHEIRTPMNGVLGMTYLALACDLPPKARDYVEEIRLSAQRLLGIINDILDISKIEAGQILIEHIAFDLARLISDTVAIIGNAATAKGLAVVVEISPEVPGNLIGDPLRIGQVLLNYLNNAVKFTERGEVAVTVNVEGLEDGIILLRFSVSDTGVGVAQDQQANLFQSFRQTDASITRRYGGTGLGLAIAKELAGLMGGEVGVDSTIGLGSTFWFTIRCKASTEVATAAAEVVDGRMGSTGDLKSSAADHAILHGTRVLLVEDDSTNQMVAVGLLEAAGMKVDVAEDGVAALEKMKTTDYEIVLMDVYMPKMDGITATRLIREQKSLDDLPIIALTANAMQEQQKQFLAAGMNDVVGKPFDPGQLYTVIHKWVTGSGMSSVLGLSVNSARQGSCLRLPGAIAGLDIRAGLRRMAGMKVLYVNALQIFAEQQRGIVARIRKSIAECDKDTATRHAHTLKGAAGMIEAREVCELAAAIEAELVGETLNLELLDRLEGKVLPLIDAIQSALDGQQDQPAPKSGADDGKNAAKNLARLVWQADYECGHPVVDEQHRSLFGMANKLLAAHLTNDPTNEVGVLIDALISAVVQHFQDEETILLTAGLPGAEQHGEIHRTLKDHAVRLSDHFHAGTLGLGELFQFLVQDVIGQHMLGADRELFTGMETQVTQFTEGS